MDEILFLTSFFINIILKLTSLQIINNRAQKISAPAAAVAVAFISSENGIGFLSSSSSNQKDVVHAESSAPSPLVNMEKVKAAIGHLIEADAEKRNDGTSLKGTFVRLGESIYLDVTWTIFIKFENMMCT